MKTSDEKMDCDSKESKHSPGYEPSIQHRQQDKRSLDIGESGQFAPGGYYNQQGKNAPKRIDLDEELVPRRHRGGSE